MKPKDKNKPKKVNKGMPSAVLLSILIHAGLFLLAGMLVVFTVKKVNEPEFEAPKAVERPKMKLKKPKVRMKKSSKPKSTTRIVTRTKRTSMPDIQLPEMSGLGDGLGDGVGGGFDMMPDLGNVSSLFGGGVTTGNDFVGKFYDFKRTRDGRLLVPDTTTFKENVGRFTRGDWDPAVLRKYYCSPRTLYATTFMVPLSLSSMAPAAFGEADTLGYCWVAHYVGKLVHKEGITFRFWGHGDDILIVRVNGEIVLNASWPGTETVYSSWVNTTADNRKYLLGSQRAVVGNWITLEPGVPLDMEVVIGEVPGGVFCAMLLVEEKEVEYERNGQSGPILPIFKTEPLSLDLRDEIACLLFEDEASLSNEGPIFSEYDYSQSASTNTIQDSNPEAALMAQSDASDSTLRMWTRLDGKSFEAELVATVGTYAVFENARGKQQKVPIDQLTEDDRRIAELSDPPELSIDVPRKTKQRMLQMSPYSGRELPSIVDMVFSTRVKQVGAHPYNHELHIECFVIGQEVLGDKYILLDRFESRFTPSRENERSHEFFSSKTVEMYNYNLNNQRYGRKYDGFLVLVTDERGEIIHHDATSKWLYENRENLKEIPVGRHMDKTCTRVIPTSPSSDRY